MGIPLRVLIIEDSEDDMLLLVRMLRKGGYDPVYERVETADAMHEALERQTWEIIISDYKMPRFNGLEALKLYKEKGLDIPFIIVSGTIGEEIAVEAMKIGAHDYVMKNNLPRLAPAIQRELREAESRRELKQVEGALKMSEQKYHSIFENVVEGIFQTTPEGRFFTVNPSLARIYGYDSPEEVIDTVTDIGRQVYVNPDERDEFLRIIQEKGIVTNLEVQLRKKDGSTFWASINARTVYDENGKLLYYEGTSEEITLRKQAEEKILALLVSVQKEKNRISALLESMSDEVWFADTQKRFTIANPAALKQFCLDLNQTVEVEKLAKNLIILRPDGSPRPVEEAPPLRALSGELVTNQEELVQVPVSGEFRYRQVNAAPVKDAAGSIIGSVSVVRDITDRKFAEKALKESEQKYRSIFENAVEGIFQATPKGQFISVNPALASMIGYDSPEAMIKDVTNVEKQLYVNPAERIRYKKILDEQDTVKEFEIQHYKKDKSKIWVSINARTVKDEAGRLLYYEGTIEDITSRKLSEEKLRKALAGTIQVVSTTVETRDPYTAGHQRKVSNLARAIAQEMGLSNDTVDTIRMAGIIHDIGKISVPAEILSKPGKISDIEFSLIKVHSQTGYDILKDVGLPYPIAEIVLQHHERLDGSGYPQGLKNGQILLETRIISVADVVEAISSFRPYRPGFGIDVALQEIEKNKCILYDEKAVLACVKLFREKGFKFEITES